MEESGPETWEILEARKYHEWYYNTKVWRRTTFMGVACLKSVSDMWNYQEIIWRLKPALIVEFGTCRGGATLFFSFILGSIRKKYRVLTVDLNLDSQARTMLKKHPNIQVMECSSIDPKVGEEIRRLRKCFPGPVFYILDSDHTKDHVLAEMESLRDITRHGDYLVVEDGNINGHPVLTEFGDGPWEAIEAYCLKYPEDFIRDTQAEEKFGFTFAPRGFLIRQ